MTSVATPLRYGAFRAMWLASVFSSIGSFLQAVAAAWLMLEMTGSNTWVGLMVASSTLPLLFLALAAGALADMFDRTRIMLTAQIIMGGSAAAMSILSYTGLITPGLLLGLGLAMGSGLALNLPAWQALVPDLVPREMVASAVALNSVAFNVARAIGPALGGLVVATIGPELGFGINALSYLIVIFAIVLVGRRLEPPTPDATSIGDAIGVGVRFARFTPPFRRLLGLVALFAVTSAVVQSVLPDHTRTLGGQAGTYGVLLGAMGVGALLAAVIRRPVMERLGGSSRSVTIGLFGVAGVGLGVAPSVAWASVALLVAGANWVLTLTSLNATAQLMSPEWIRGRAMSFYSLAFAGILPLGAILAGILADVSGTRWALVIMSMGTLVLATLTRSFRVPGLTDVETPEFTGAATPPQHEVTLAGGPVLILNTWTISKDDFEAFVDSMNELRLVRLRTGARRWRLYRSAADPTILTEVFSNSSWGDHLRQHRRIDDASAEVIRRARSFDVGGGPQTTHLIDLDVEEPPEFGALVESHRQLHATDGSIPLPEDG